MAYVHTSIWPKARTPFQSWCRVALLETRSLYYDTFRCAWSAPVCSAEAASWVFFIHSSHSNSVDSITWTNFIFLQDAHDECASLKIGVQGLKNRISTTFERFLVTLQLLPQQVKLLIWQHSTSPNPYLKRSPRNNTSSTRAFISSRKSQMPFTQQTREFFLVVAKPKYLIQLNSACKEEMRNRQDVGFQSRQSINSR